VREVQDELRTRRGLEAERVLVTSDEQDPAWWAEVHARGWARIDYSTVEAREDALGAWCVSV
jgi:hypothetical protein